MLRQGACPDRPKAWPRDLLAVLGLPTRLPLICGLAVHSPSSSGLSDLSQAPDEMMSPVTLSVNGDSHTVDVDPSTPLLYILRNDLRLRGPRFGCGLGQCGSCAVIVDGTAIRSCITPVSSISSEITTLEGLSEDGELHPVQQAWIEEQVPQCGYCQNGQMMTAKALLDRKSKPDGRGSPTGG